MPLGPRLILLVLEMIANAVIFVAEIYSVMIIMASLWIPTWALTQVMEVTLQHVRCYAGRMDYRTVYWRRPSCSCYCCFYLRCVAVCTPAAIQQTQ